MFGLGIGELLIILVIVLLIFGAGKLPQIGDALGKSIKNFKRASQGQNEIEVSKKKELASTADDHEDAEIVGKPEVKAVKRYLATAPTRSGRGRSRRRSCPRPGPSPTRCPRPGTARRSAARGPA